MPWLTDAVREERRLHIAEAALRSFGRDGIAGTSMADIITEAGLSAGSIYSHFSSKTDLMRYASRIAMETHFSPAATTGETDETGARAGAQPLDPPAALRRLLAVARRSETRALLLEIWAEAARDPDLAGIVEGNITGMKTLIATWLTPWATAVAGEHGAADLVAANSDALLAMLHGYVVRLTIDPAADPLHLAEHLVSSLPASTSSAAV